MPPPVASAPHRASRARRPHTLDLAFFQSFTKTIFGAFLHAKRLESITNAATGVLHAANLAIAAIGASYAALVGGQSKHGIKQVDRLLSNEAFVVWRLFDPWVKFVVAERKQIVVALDWTDFEKDDHTTICAYLMTRHGRATPLLWRTVKKSKLKGERNNEEDRLLERLQEILPKEIEVTLLADRGFGDQKLYELLTLWGWDFIIRFRESILVETTNGSCKLAAEWVGNGRARMLKNVRVTANRALLAAVVVVHARRMKDPWCLATSLANHRAQEVVKLYGKRFRIEETFRDQKDNHFGMGLSATHIKNEQRRDRLLFLAALAYTLLTLLGAASEETGLDRTLKVNTAQKRTHSLFRQGLYWYHALLTLREEWFVKLMTAFNRIVTNQPFCREIFGII